MRKTSVRFHIVGLVLSLTGTLWFFRATVLVGYAAGYGIAQADHNHKVFLLTTLAFLVAFIALAISFGVNAIRSRKSQGRVS
jgi:hypothetical protein